MNRFLRSSLMSALLAWVLFGIVATAQADTRLVSTDALATELIFALQADQYLVAVDVIEGESHADSRQAACDVVPGRVNHSLHPPDPRSGLCHLHGETCGQ